MSTMTFDSNFVKSVSDTGFSVRPTGLTRRGRLARTFVVLSLAVVFGSGYALQAGAGDSEGAPATGSYVVVTVAPGDSVWSIAGAVADGRDVRAVVDQIVTANSLPGASVSAGQKIRVPLK
jgi:hypothetical protein